MTNAADTVPPASAAQEMRRLVNLARSLQLRHAEQAAEARRARETLRTRHRAAERRIRVKVSEFSPDDLGGELRRRLRAAAFPEPPPRPARAPPASIEAAQEEWREVAPVQRDVRELVSARRAWESRLIKRRSTLPVVEQTVWDRTYRLSEIHEALPVLRESAVADQLAALEGEREGLNREQAVVRAELDELQRLARETIEAVSLAQPLSGLPWTDARWRASTLTPGEGGIVRLGEFSARLADGTSLPPIPALIDFPFDSGVLVGAGVEDRAAAVQLVRALVFRLLTAVQPGAARFVFADAIGLGQSVADLRHLAEFDDHLVDRKTWTSERDIEQRLQDLSDHLEVVISTYLRGQFDTIDEYNQHAGEVAEPYRVLVVFDYPHGFNERSARQLLSLVENGPKCGVHTIVLSDAFRASEAPVGLERLAHSMSQVTLSGEHARVIFPAPLGEIDMDLLPDFAPSAEFGVDGTPRTASASLLLAVGQATLARRTQPVTLDAVLPLVNRLVASGRAAHAPDPLPHAAPIDAGDPATWWGATSAGAATALLGRTGAQDIAALRFSSTDIAGGAILVGLPRSGKTTALHAAITSLALLYSPEELELHLVDSKHGVEFKAYTDLPHARLVSVHSEREFAVAVLSNLVTEIEHRAELMKVHGVSNITTYRAATEQPMPRIVLVMDEFHEVFETNDALSGAAFDAFSDIVRQGPFAGVHMIVSSQTLSSMPAMDRETLQLLPMRVAFMCNELDADLVMGDSARDAKALSVQGEGLLNSLRGVAGHSQRFRGVFVSPPERTVLLDAVRERANALGFDRTPRCFDGRSFAERPEAPEGSAERPELALGEPFDLRPWAGFALRRRRGANLAVLASGAEDQHDLAGDAVVHSIVRDASAQGVAVEVVDLLADGPLEEGAVDLAGLCAAADAHYIPGARLDAVLADVAALVRERRAAETFDAATRLLVINGLQRARLVPWTEYAESDDVAPGDLRTIVVDGPEVGVHVVLVVDSMAQFDRRCGRDLLADCELRVAGRSAAPADVGVLVDDHREHHLIRHQLLLVDRSRSSARRVRGYPLCPAISEGSSQ